MIAIENANDFEFYSANSAGGIQGHGYQCRNAGSVLVLISSITGSHRRDLQATLDSHRQLSELVYSRHRSR